VDFSEFLGSLVLSPEFIEGPVLSNVEGLLLCTCAEPCPDDRSGSIQYQDKEVREKSKLYEKSTIKDSVREIYNTYRNNSGSFKSLNTKKQYLRIAS